jgi:hypothetical protein
MHRLFLWELSSGSLKESESAIYLGVEVIIIVYGGGGITK